MVSSKKNAARKARSARGGVKPAAPARKPASKASARRRKATADTRRWGQAKAVEASGQKRAKASATASGKRAAAGQATAAAKATPPAPARNGAARNGAATKNLPTAEPRARVGTSELPAARPRRLPGSFAKPAVSARSGLKPSRGRDTLQDVGGPAAIPGLSEEDQIRAAKYLPRELPRRLFEEERFLFPETYGLNRIRLLVRDPEWIFAYWDVSPEAMKDLGRKLGERALALSRLTLRVVDPVSGASSDILLPPGARWWYVRTDSARRTYRAELGVTLPSGEFRRLAESNTVVTPRVGPSAERARRRISYPESREIPLSAAEAAVAADQRTDVAREPWPPGAIEGAAEPDAAGGGGAGGESGRKGGASDTLRPGGASDTFRPGASDGFRR